MKVKARTSAGNSTPNVSPAPLNLFRRRCVSFTPVETTLPSLLHSAILPALRAMQAPILRRPPPLLVPGSATAPLRLAHQAAFAPDSKVAPYVLHVVSLGPTVGYLFAGSDDSLRAFSPTLEPLATLKSSQKGITSLVRGAGEGSTAVFSTARDGTVVGWDTRDLSKEAFKLKSEFS